MQATDTAPTTPPAPPADELSAEPPKETASQSAGASDIVPRYRRIDPEREVMLRGAQLQDGMRVLIADPTRRAADTPPRSSSLALVAEHDHERRTWNRWCVVRQPTGEARVSFVGEYADGDLQVRDYAGTTLWVVQRDSIPDSLPKEPSDPTSVAQVAPASWTTMGDVRRLPIIVWRYRLLVTVLAAVLLLIGLLWIVTGVLPGDRGSVPDGALLLVTGAGTLLARRFLDPR